MTTVIRDCDWIIAWDAASRCHTYRRGGDVAFDKLILQVGGRFEGTASRELSGKGRLVMPGLVDLHSHPSLEPAYRGVREEHGLRQMFMTGLYERSIAFWPDAEGQVAAAEVAFCEMALSGVTTVADLSNPYDGWLELLARSGLRAFMAPGFASARWTLDSHFNLGFNWDEAAGHRGLEAALKLIGQARNHPAGRLSGIVYPAQIDTCTPELLDAAARAAKQQGLPLTTHAAQSVNEFFEMLRRTGKTPVQFAGEVGILGPNLTLAHGIFIDDHSWLHWRPSRDLALLAETGTSIAHCPTPFARYGAVLENFGRYRGVGINLGIGTDTTPHNMIEEIRLALILAKTQSGDVENATLSDVFHAATVGGAKALLTSDIGRLEPACKADIVLVDLEHPWIKPARDPLRSLVFHAADRAVTHVFVDGNPVVEDRCVTTLDRASALDRLGEAQQRMLHGAPARDGLKRSADQIAPLSLPVLA